MWLFVQYICVSPITLQYLVAHSFMQKGWSGQHLDKKNSFFQSDNCKFFPNVALMRINRSEVLTVPRTHAYLLLFCNSATILPHLWWNTFVFSRSQCKIELFDLWKAENFYLTVHVEHPYRWNIPIQRTFINMQHPCTWNLPTWKRTALQREPLYIWNTPTQRTF
jgi:hypothetical protein